MADQSPALSVGIPVHNEEPSLPELYRQLTAVLEGLRLTYEIILVDDGSEDRSFAVIQDLHARDPRIVGLRFSRNFGHQAAISAAYEWARGEAVICMDADLQHPPALVPEFVRKWREGYNVVIGVKKEETSSLFRRVTTGLAYGLMKRIADVEMPAHAPDFRLLDRKALTALLALPERQRLLRGLVAWIGFRSAEIEFEVAPRFAGRSSYSFFKLVRLAIDGTFSFSVMPLRISTLLGLLVSVGAFGYLLFALGARLFASLPPRGWASVIASFLLLGGCQLIILGVIGEYIGRIYHELKQRPLYIVEEVLGASPPSRRKA